MCIPVFCGATVLLVTPESQGGQLACDCELFLTVAPFCFIVSCGIMSMYDQVFPGLKRLQLVVHMAWTLAAS